MFLGELLQPVNRLKGIGPNHHKSLSALGIFTIGQLLSHFPVRYEDHQSDKTILQAAGIEAVNTQMTIVGKESFSWKGRPTLKLLVEDDSASGSLLCYGRNFLGGKLLTGTQIYIYGQFQYRFGEWQCGAFEFEIVSDCPEKYGKILPLYPLGGSLNQNVLRKAIQQGIREYTPGLKEELPEILKAQYGWPDRLSALKNIHNPGSPQEAEQARDYFIYEELFHLQTAVGRNAVKQRQINRTDKIRLPRKLEKKLKSTLPFSLTSDQEKVLDEIVSDLEGNRGMNRLIQGDVGSGKTLVAFLAALNVIEGGRQAALMAPTELLARQHADNASRLLTPLGITIAYLSGNTQGEGRRHLLTQLKEGNIQFVVGTHALFSEDVQYRELGLAVIDEQHRFGVAQRQMLAKKGHCVDLLYMTATPIPRTLAMTAFGDLDVSTIKTMPPGRKTIETHLTREGNEEKVYTFVLNELNKGRQAYFVYPLIEKSEKLDLKDAENMFEQLQKTFPDHALALIHSRIPDEEKKERMERFSKGNVDLLVATSVVEVGVDVPNATIMVIEHAERFGLSALHQLRGRVGRSEKQSYAFLIYSNNLTEEGKQRLRVMMENSDGFVIAEEDLKLRGPGEIAGVRQSGYMKFRIADMIRDSDVLLKARQDVMSILEKDPDLKSPEFSLLRELWESAPPFSETLIRTG
ncbi:ATP-dependent DNA helicase RecG [Oceanispirochaeta crateris]|uniref:ATP-dependent DNA helicase RecG n=1 Tax=Oceanispirochaeta crateris TaxID=2518645 RepID=A0A5C1QL68_9SPIO|nr:ATP-dependent DNA helicase RecG [Oceanispirochaeta crateris]QEN07959.1 ATP-dependent DNA helicase RecG [Oceanispirochaeta crateris]